MTGSQILLVTKDIDTFEKLILNVHQNEMYDNFFTKVSVYIFLQKHLWFCFRTKIKFRMMKFEFSSTTDQE